MKVLRLLPLLAITTSLFGASAFADDKDKKHDKKHDKDHDHDRGSDYRGYDEGRPRVNVGIGLAPRPYYGPSSTVIVERRRPVIIERERPVYYGERQVYVERSANAGGGSLGVQVQRGLARRGYYQGPVDGDIGPASRDAIRNYQRDHGLRPTGLIDERLLDALN